MKMRTTFRIKCHWICGLFFVVVFVQLLVTLRVAHLRHRDVQHSRSAELFKNYKTQFQKTNSSSEEHFTNNTKFQSVRVSDSLIKQLNTTNMAADSLPSPVSSSFTTQEIIQFQPAECNSSQLSNFMECARRTIMSTKELTTFVLLIRLVTTLFDYHKIPFTLSGASLIGYHHREGMLPWDEDFDILSVCDHLDQLHDIFDKHLWPKFLPAVGEDMPALSLSATRELYNQLVFVEEKKIYLNSTKHCLHKTEYPWCWPFVDILFYRSNGTHYSYPFYETSEDYFTYEMLFPLRRVTFDGIPVWIPNNIRRFMGEDPDTVCITRLWNHKYEVHSSCFEVIDCQCLETEWPTLNSHLNVSP